MHSAWRFVLGLVVAGVLSSTVAAWAQSATCCGDCNGDGRVTVNEIITLVNIVLGTESNAACPNAAACTGCGHLGACELLKPVINAMAGCAPASAASPTPAPVR